MTQEPRNANNWLWTAAAKPFARSRPLPLTLIDIPSLISRWAFAISATVNRARKRALAAGSGGRDMDKQPIAAARKYGCLCAGAIRLSWCLSAPAERCRTIVRGKARRDMCARLSFTSGHWYTCLLAMWVWGVCYGIANWYEDDCRSAKSTRSF